MGACSSRKHKKSNKGKKKLMKGKNFKRCNDQIIDDMMSNSASFVMKSIENEGLNVEDYEYCIVCSKHFSSVETLAIHKRTKAHKRKVKILQKKPYSHEESRKAGGFGSYTPNFFRPVHLDAMKALINDAETSLGRRRAKKQTKKNDVDLSVVESIRNLCI